MINPEFTPGNIESDYADSLMWVAVADALGFEDGDFEQVVEDAFAKNRIGTLARVAARLEIIDDNDTRALDVLLVDDFVAIALRDMIDMRIVNLSIAEQRIYGAIRDDEKEVLAAEQKQRDLIHQAC